MFNVGDQVEFGVRYNSKGSQRGGIAKLNGIIADKITVNQQPIIVVRQNDAKSTTYNLRQLKNGWVVEYERDDPKGRLYLRKVD